jgi:hypothetical protein
MCSNLDLISTNFNGRLIVVDYSSCRSQRDLQFTTLRIPGSPCNPIDTTAAPYFSKPFPPFALPASGFP